jgi:hypothetical protein
MPHSPAPPHRPRIHFRAEGLRLTTSGLHEIDHPELTLLAGDPGELAAARGVLLSLATDVVFRNHHFAAGEGVRFDGAVLYLAPATLELWELDPGSGLLVRGAPRLLASLKEDGE